MLMELKLSDGRIHTFEVSVVSLMNVSTHVEFLRRAGFIY